MTANVYGPAIPGECAALIRRLYEAIFRGDYQACSLLQEQANDCLRQHGLTASEKPQEFFELMHEWLNVLGRDPQRETELGAQLKPYMIIPMQVVPAATDDSAAAYPAEYTELQSQAEAAFERQDWPEVKRLCQEIEAIYEQMGFINVINIIR